MLVEWKSGRFVELEKLKTGDQFLWEGALHMKVWPASQVGAANWAAGAFGSDQALVSNLENGAVYPLHTSSVVQPVQGRFVES